MARGNRRRHTAASRRLLLLDVSAVNMNALRRRWPRPWSAGAESAGLAERNRSQAQRRRQASRRTRRIRPDGELSCGVGPRAEAGRRLARLAPTRSGRGGAGVEDRSTLSRAMRPSWTTIRHQFATFDLYRDVTRLVTDGNGVWATVQPFRCHLPQFEAATERARATRCPAARTSRPPPSRVRQADRTDGRCPARLCTTKVL